MFVIIGKTTESIICCYWNCGGGYKCCGCVCVLTWNSCGGDGGGGDPPCSPKTCASFNPDKECGKWGNGCGGTIKCGNKTNGACLNPLDVCITATGECCFPEETKCKNSSECCSDNCNYFTESPSSAGLIAWSGISSMQPACCNSSYIIDAVSECRETSSENGIGVYVGVGGDDRFAAPLKDGWADCDSGTNPGGACSNICQLAMKAGASNVGEYPNRNTLACCGDDPGEYKAIGGKVMGSPGPRCCPNSDDCVDEQGNCVAEGTLLNGRYCNSCGWMLPNWDGSKNGCCPGTEMCLVDPNGDPDKKVSNWYEVNWANQPDPISGPQCINAGEYILEHRCGQESEWESRTKYISLMMLTKAEEDGDDYVLFCDNFTNTLNYYRYPIDELELDFSFLETGGECGNYPCLNNYFCVLLDKDGKLRAVGGTLNPDKQGDLNNVGMVYKILKLHDAVCELESSNEFVDCGNGLSYNAGVGAFIYTKDGDSLASQININSIVDWFKSIIGLYKAVIPKDVKIGVYEGRSPSFNRLFVLKNKDKMIYAIQDTNERVERMFINYTHFNTDVCLMVNSSLVKGSSACNSNENSQYLFANRTVGSKKNPMMDDWIELTAKMRVSYEPFVARQAVCVGEGGSIPVIQFPPDCCAGLDIIKPKVSGTVGSDGICTNLCGNAVCNNETESNYNCAVDCAAG